MTNEVLDLAASGTPSHIHQVLDAKVQAPEPLLGELYRRRRAEQTDSEHLHVLGSVLLLMHGEPLGEEGLRGLPPACGHAGGVRAHQQHVVHVEGVCRSLLH